ncbi:STAS domain-containing protein [Mycobacterium angelicum]|uniref:STAS domain-containing protein n=1 Tax=Mycobacterium angelicum TaxID=470074 RepID=A0A1W9ZXD0_MYCAN|nr:STAS domain-containing protein [Mycobacterium angelicum]MCV7198473.1 STAS domain-containing protein [Mycobacterium angelicum]ORA22437.1 hypothetical protein BST12_09770 [Mycobacterium angelicum]
MNAQQFHFAPGEGDRAPVVTACGDIDLANVGELQEVIACAMVAANAVTLDLTAVTYCDSSTVRALFDAAATTQVTIVIADDSAVRTLLSISGLDRVANVITANRGQSPA